MENKKVYVRPEDICELILTKTENKEWITISQVKTNIIKILSYFKEEKFDKLQNEFGL